MLTSETFVQAGFRKVYKPTRYIKEIPGSIISAVITITVEDNQHFQLDFFAYTTGFTFDRITTITSNTDFHGIVDMYFNMALLAYTGMVQSKCFVN